MVDILSSLVGGTSKCYYFEVFGAIMAEEGVVCQEGGFYAVVLSPSSWWSYGITIEFKARVVEDVGGRAVVNVHDRASGG